ELDVPQRNRSRGPVRDERRAPQCVNDRQAVVEVIERVGAKVDVFAGTWVHPIEPVLEPACCDAQSLAEGHEATGPQLRCTKVREHAQVLAGCQRGRRLLEYVVPVRRCWWLVFFLSGTPRSDRSLLTEELVTIKRGERGRVVEVLPARGGLRQRMRQPIKH